MTLDFQPPQPPDEAAPEIAAARTLGASFAHSADPADTITINGLVLHGSFTDVLMVGDGAGTMATAKDLRRIAAFLTGAADVLDIRGREQRQQAEIGSRDIHASFLGQQGFAVGRGNVGGPTTQERDA